MRDKPSLNRNINKHYKAENWHAWAHEQYLLKHRFLDIFVDVPLKLLQKLWYDASELSGYHIIKDHEACKNWYLDYVTLITMIRWRDLKEWYPIILVCIPIKVGDCSLPEICVMTFLYLSHDHVVKGNATDRIGVILLFLQIILQNLVHMQHPFWHCDTMKI